MSIQVSYPGVYIEEIASGQPVVTAVTTASTGFVDYFARGPVGVATQINTWTNFQQVYGGLDPKSEASYAIYQYFLNGGQIAWVVRVANGATTASATDATTGFSFQAANPGVWGNTIICTITQPQQVGQAAIAPGVFNLAVAQAAKGGGASENYLNLSLDPTSAQYAPAVINAASQLIQVPSTTTNGVTTYTLPAMPAQGVQNPIPESLLMTFSGGTNGTLPEATDFTDQLGAFLLIAPSMINTLCLPATANASAGDASSAINAALSWCNANKAFYIVDIPSTIVTVQAMTSWAQANVLNANNYVGAVYFPRLVIPDPNANYQPKNVASSGTIAGVYARIDNTEGVWVAPAGTEATIINANLAVQIGDSQNGQLNPLGINALRSFPVFGNLIWGARTLAGADQISSQWKYIPVRRLLNFIELSLQQSLKWAVFQPNDQALWTNITVEAGNFLAGLYSQGAFAGATASAAYFVQCDSTTTTPTDIAQGICNVIIGVAPVQPAEFIVLQIQQIAGQTTAS
ncbi:MAG TPA: phage tail sheath C-terminal domain-containing protein [Thermoanaerobaculia bacterium]|nr:phage tail sheath C-terminal domain-containing protein [Thermoanaerobaculia bacterium]